MFFGITRRHLQLTRRLRLLMGKSSLCTSYVKALIHECWTSMYDKGTRGRGGQEEGLHTEPSSVARGTKGRLCSEPQLPLPPYRDIVLSALLSQCSCHQSIVWWAGNLYQKDTSSNLHAIICWVFLSWVCYSQSLNFNFIVCDMGILIISS